MIAIWPRNGLGVAKMVNMASSLEEISTYRSLKFGGKFQIALSPGPERDTYHHHGVGGSPHGSRKTTGPPLRSVWTRSPLRRRYAAWGGGCMAPINYGSSGRLRKQCWPGAGRS